MIKDTELRKGNLLILNVNYKENTHRVDEIYTEEVKVTSVEDGGCFPRMILKSCNPIPLTPDWLRKCGFGYITSENVSYYIRIGANLLLEFDQILACRLALETPMYKTIIHITAEIKYLHQLQNLYQSHTGKELEIKF